MTYSKNVIDFFGKNKIFYSTFLQRIDQKEILSKYISLKLNREYKLCHRILCIGGGSGEGDLGIIKKLRKNDFKIDYVDPSKEMRSVFVKNSKKEGLANNLGEVTVDKFESKTFKPKKYDVIFCINTIYFIDGWKNKTKNNPLLKIYNALNDSGIAIIVVRSSDSDHRIIKRTAGGGRVTGLVVREKLRKLEIPYYVETVPSYINLSDCFKNQEFKPNKKGNKLLSFIFGDRWKKLTNEKKQEVINAIKERMKIINGKPVLEAKHEYIWIYKHNHEPNYESNDELDKKARKLAQKIKKKIQTIPNFPVKGILFRDTTPLMRDFKMFQEIIEYAKCKYKKEKIDFVVAKDMQALIWAGALAKALKCGVVPMFRKDLAGNVLTATYKHEYNANRVVNLQKHAIKKGNRVLLIDYIMATGGTMRVMAKLIEHLGGTVAGIFSITELEYQNARKGLEKYNVHTIVKY